LVAPPHTVFTIFSLGEITPQRRNASLSVEAGPRPNGLAGRRHTNPTTETTMNRTHLIPAIAAAAVLALSASGAVRADQINVATTNIESSTTRGLSKPIFKLCPDPAPMFMEYSKGSVQYHPELSYIALKGTVQNIGGGQFVPGAAPQAIELWVQWGATAPKKVKTVALPTMAPGAVQTIDTTFEPADYKAKLAQYGGSPKLTLMVNTNAGSAIGTKDCKLGEANIHWIYGPSVGELQAMGISG
jgi:hypothetical protein